METIRVSVDQVNPNADEGQRKDRKGSHSSFGKSVKRVGITTCGSEGYAGYRGVGRVVSVTVLGQ
jgi:hypothetical protein